MANVLGELFGDIASAIREKTGDTATMKPAEFPEKIAGIEVGGGSGGSAKVFSGYITGNSSMDTRYNVNFGFVPDVILVLIQPSNTALKEAAIGYYAISQKLADASSLAKGRLWYTNTKNMYYDAMGVFTTSRDVNKQISGVDETGFYLGNYNPYSGVSYLVLAFGGLA
jgi:hypothetical protein